LSTGKKGEGRIGSLSEQSPSFDAMKVILKEWDGIQKPGVIFNLASSGMPQRAILNFTPDPQG
jgi:hypothetical protein